MAFIWKAAEDLQPGDRMFIGVGLGGATIEKVYPVGDAAIPDRVHLVFDNKYDNKRVIRDWKATEVMAVYPENL